MNLGNNDAGCRRVDDAEGREGSISREISFESGVEGERLCCRKERRRSGNRWGSAQRVLAEVLLGLRRC